MDQLINFGNVNPLQDYGHCIIKEELIISEAEEEDEELVYVETVDESCNKLPAHFKIFESSKKPTGHENNKKDKVLQQKSSTVRENKNSQSTLKKAEPLEKISSNEFVVIVEPNIDTAMKKLTKSHCSTCNKKSKTTPRKRHCNKCTTPLTYICDNCEKTFKTYYTLCYHLKAKHVIVSSPLKCSKCDRLFVQRPNMLAHQRVCGRDPAYGCDECTYRAYYKSNLIKHIEEKHSGRVYDCKTCVKIFSNQRSLNRHVKCYCGKKKAFQCHHCTHKVYRKDHMIGHLSRVHSEVYKKKERVVRNCEYCGVVLKRFEHLRYHLERCKLAPKAQKAEMADQPDLDTAVKKLSKARCLKCNKKHSVIRGMAQRCNDCKMPLSYHCNSCGKSWSSSTSLREHMKAKHVKNVAYHRCDKCDCSYTHKKHLTIHQRVRHSKVVTIDGYKCLKCGKEFSSATNMTKHKKVCGQEPTFFCDLCSYKTHFKASLWSHFKGKHSMYSQCK